MGGEGKTEQGAAMAGRVPGPATTARDKSSFAVTCSLLSQYLKEKKGDFHHGLSSLGMAPPPAGEEVVFRPPTTMNLLSALDAPAEEPKKLSLDENASKEPPALVAPADQQKGKNPSEETGEDQAQQLTIFYGGRVVVFDDVPATKVKDLLQMANGGRHGVDKASSNAAAAQNLPKPNSRDLSDIPIARRNSLHRFLEKRKGRIIAKAPYQVDTSAEASNKQETGEKSWLALGKEVAIRQENDLGNK